MYVKNFWFITFTVHASLTSLRNSGCNPTALSHGLRGGWAGIRHTASCLLRPARRPARLFLGSHPNVRWPVAPGSIPARRKSGGCTPREGRRDPAPPKSYPCTASCLVATLLQRGILPRYLLKSHMNVKWLARDSARCAFASLARQDERLSSFDGIPCLFCRGARTKKNNTAPTRAM
jgi:hypothetical protein